jgi:hypothetical protein
MADAQSRGCYQERANNGSAGQNPNRSRPAKDQCASSNNERNPCQPEELLSQFFMSFDCRLGNSSPDALALTLARIHGHETGAQQNRLKDND